MPPPSTAALTAAPCPATALPPEVQAVLDTLPGAAAVLTPENVVLAWNAAWATDPLTGDLTVGQDYGAALADWTGRCALHELAQVGRDGHRVDREVHLVHVDRWVRVRARALAGASDRVLVLHDDVTGSRQAEQALLHAAGCDELTGLPNRSTYLARLRAAMAGDRPLTVVFLDVDHFKLVNDSLGHAAGDDLLVEVAGRLRTAVRPEDLVARLGGDEFAVLGEGVEAELGFAERLQAAFDAPFAVAGSARHARASLGCRTWSPLDPPCTAEDLLRDADAAMYEAKASGRGRTRTFSAATRDAVLHRVSLEADLREALAADQLDVHYQPVLDLVTGQVTGCEALVRWTSPTRGAVPPGDFVPLAEETGLIAPLGLHVLREACTQLVAWRRTGAGRLAVSVNVSPVQLQQPAFRDDVVRVLEQTGADPSLLCLEFTESALQETTGQTAQTLRELQALGVYVALDDFGTGHSSLARLRSMPVEVLKIDRSFVRGLGVEPEDSAIVAAIMSMAHTLGLHVVAEGVETEVQADELRALGCTAVQGWLYAPALPAGQVVDFCAARPVRPVVRRRLRRREAMPLAPRTRAHRSLVLEMMSTIGIDVAEAW